MKTRWFAIGLILVGAALLADSIGLLHIGWAISIWTLLAIFGGYILWKGFTQPGGKGIVWGTVLLALGVSNVLKDGDLVCIPPHIQFPLLLMVVGLGLVLRFVRVPASWSGLVAGVILLLAGGAVWLDEIGMLDSWQLRGFVTMYWPVALVLFGAAFLIPSRKTTQVQ